MAPGRPFLALVLSLISGGIAAAQAPTAAPSSPAVASAILLP